MASCSGYSHFLAALLLSPDLSWPATCSTLCVATDVDIMKQCLKVMSGRKRGREGCWKWEGAKFGKTGKVAWQRTLAASRQIGRSTRMLG